MSKPTMLKKQEIMDRWDSLEPGPIRMEPMTPGKGKSSYVEDSIRITGSQEFIDGVLAHLKGMMEYECATSRLDPRYVETSERTRDGDGKIVQGGLTGAWACYLKAVARTTGTGRRGRKPGSKNRPKEFPGTKPKPLPNGFKEIVPVTAVIHDGPVQGPRKKGEKRPTIVAPMATPKPSTIDPEPLYAIATKVEPDEDFPDGWNWTEPACDPDSGLPMDTYFDISSCDDAIKSLKRDKRFAKDDLWIVEVNRNKSGNISYVEV